MITAGRSILSRLSFTLGIVAAAALAGCGSFSDSSVSISDLVSSPFTSSSRSSSPEIAYGEDVRDFTKAHVKAGGTAAALKTEITRIAGEHGISDWEASSTTWVAIGEGLRGAGYNATEADAFTKLLEPTEKQQKWIRQGLAR